MNIAVISFDDVDVSKGLTELAKLYKEKSPTFLLPVTTSTEVFTQSVLKTAIDNKIKVTCFFDSAVGLDHILKQADDISLTENPIGEVLHTLKPDDALAIVWDDSPESHVIVHGLEDLALDMWDITDGLDEIEHNDFDMTMDGEKLHQEMTETMGRLVDLMCAFVANTVMASLTEAVSEHIMMSEVDGDTKDIDPFKNLE